MNTVKFLLVLSFMFVQVFCKADQRPYVASTTDVDNISCVNPGTNVAGSQCSGTTINYVCNADNLDSATCNKN